MKTSFWIVLIILAFLFGAAIPIKLNYKPPRGYLLDALWVKEAAQQELLRDPALNSQGTNEQLRELLLSRISASIGDYEIYRNSEGATIERVGDKSVKWHNTRKLN